MGKRGMRNERCMDGMGSESERESLLDKGILRTITTRRKKTTATPVLRLSHDNAQTPNHIINPNGATLPRTHLVWRFPRIPPSQQATDQWAVPHPWPDIDRLPRRSSSSRTQVTPKPRRHGSHRRNAPRWRQRRPRPRRGRRHRSPCGERINTRIGTTVRIRGGKMKGGLPTPLGRRNHRNPHREGIRPRAMKIGIFRRKRRRGRPNRPGCWPRGNHRRFWAGRPGCLVRRCPVRERKDPLSVRGLIRSVPVRLVRPTPSFILLLKR